MKSNLCFIALVALFCALSSVPLWSQTAQVEGTVTDAGKPLPNVQVTLTNHGTNRVFKIKADKNGRFSAVGVPYGDYDVEIISPSGEKLYKQLTSVAPGQGTAEATLTIDISETKGSSSRSQGGQTSAGTSGQPGQATGQQPKYTKEQIEEIKKSNEKITSMKPLVDQAQTALNAKNWEAAVPPLQQLVTMDPSNWQYYSFLADAQMQLGQYDQAVDSYQKGIQAAENMTAVDPRNPITDPAKKKPGEAQMLTNLGNTYLKLKKSTEAIAAYTKAASLDANPAVAYFNLCATQYNAANTEGALDACDKAIAADPNKADAYYIKGSLLIGSSTMDKDGKMQAPPGTAEALNKYLQLAPDGPHAKDVKDMLAAIGAKVETNYKQKGK